MTFLKRVPWTSLVAHFFCVSERISREASVFQFFLQTLTFLRKALENSGICCFLRIVLHSTVSQMYFSTLVEFFVMVYAAVLQVVQIWLKKLFILWLIRFNVPAVTGASLSLVMLESVFSYQFVNMNSSWTVFLLSLFGQKKISKMNIQNSSRQRWALSGARKPSIGS